MVTDLLLVTMSCKYSGGEWGPVMEKCVMSYTS